MSPGHSIPDEGLDSVFIPSDTNQPTMADGFHVDSSGSFDDTKVIAIQVEDLDTEGLEPPRCRAKSGNPVGEGRIGTGRNGPAFQPHLTRLGRPYLPENRLMFGCRGETVGLARSHPEKLILNLPVLPLFR